MVKKLGNLSDLFKELDSDNLYNTPVILGMEHGITFRGPNSSLEDWMTETLITEEEIEKYPLAKEANRLKHTKLYKSLK